MYDFRDRLLKYHEPNIFDTARKRKQEEYMLKDGAAILIEKSAGEVTKTAAQDFADFLKISMGIDSQVVFSGNSADITIVIEN